MKTFLFALLTLLAAVAAPAQSLVSSNLLTYTAVNSTTNDGTAVLIGRAFVPTTPNFILQSGSVPVTGSNVLYLIQYGLDTNNFSTVATHYKSDTNAQDEVVTPSGITLNIYARVRVITTTNANVGTKAVFTQTP